MCVLHRAVWFFYYLIHLWPPCATQRLWFQLCKHLCQPERKPSWSTQIMLDLPTVKSVTKLKFETLTLVNNKRSPCLLAVLQSGPSEGCAELIVLSIKTWFTNWCQLSFLGTICTSGTSQWGWRDWCSFEGASTAYSTKKLPPCTECPAADVSWCRDHEATGPADTAARNRMAAWCPTGWITDTVNVYKHLDTTLLSSYLYHRDF